MVDYQKHLAAKIISENQVVTYRLLSRELKVHVNTAKQMLYDFHKSQNEKKAGSVYATYLVYGVKNVHQTPAENDGDVEMTGSSQDSGSTAEVVPTHTVTLIQEEQLHAALAEYDKVTSIHVYSIGSHQAKDLALLAEVTRQVLVLQTADDSPANRKIYGTIANTHVRRRERKGPSLQPVAAPVKQEVKETKKPSKTPTEPASAAKPMKSETEASAPKKEVAVKNEAASSAPIASKKPIPALKKTNSGIMQAFTKAAAKPKKAKEPEPKEPEPVDTPMSDDGEDDDVPLPSSRQAPSGRKTRMEREAELKQMMDMEDEKEDEDDKEEEDEEEEEQEEEPIEEAEVPAPEPSKEEPKEVVSASSDGRRRGKRRVMKKKQVMDEEGYLVTIQEAGWESFSEDEVPASAPASKPKASTAPAAAPAATKGKKAGSKAGQGNIMSFFSKK